MQEGIHKALEAAVLARRPLLNYRSNPRRQQHPRLAERLFEIAKLKMRVGVDEAGNDCDIAQVDRIGFAVVAANLQNPFTIDRHQAILDRRPIDGKDVASAETKHENTPIEILRTLYRGLRRSARHLVIFVRQVNTVLLTDLFLQRLFGAFRWRQSGKVNEDHER